MEQRRPPPSPGVAGPFTVTGNHIYAEGNTWMLKVTVHDEGDSSNTEATGTATVPDAPLTATGPSGLTVAEGGAVATTLAHFTDPGWALARIGDGGWWPAVERGLHAGEFDDEVVAGLANLLRHADIPVAWITTVPSARLGDRMVQLAARVADELGVVHAELVKRTKDRPPQRDMANSAQQAANVRRAFSIIAKPLPGTGVLLDDRCHSGWTLAMVGGQLRLAGARRVVPLVLGTLTG